MLFSMQQNIQKETDTDIEKSIFVCITFLWGLVNQVKKINALDPTYSVVTILEALIKYSGIFLRLSLETMTFFITK